MVVEYLNSCVAMIYLAMAARTCERLELATLKTGDKFKVCTMPWDYKIQGTLDYELTVINEGQQPLCAISGPNDASEIVEFRPIVVEGSGFVTTPDQNPTQAGDWLFGRPRQERAISIHYGELVAGHIMLVLNPETSPRKRAQLGRSCTSIIVYEADNDA